VSREIKRPKNVATEEYVIRKQELANASTQMAMYMLATIAALW
jgi:hypothetical protein